MSMPYDPLPGRNQINHIISQDNTNKSKWRPISAVVMRSPIIKKVKDPPKKEFKIEDLKDENRIRNIIKKNDYEDQSNKNFLSFDKEPGLPIKSKTDKRIIFNDK